jgi:hypothetical protein
MKLSKNSLRSIPSFQQFLVSLEAKYTWDKLDALVSRPLPNKATVEQGRAPEAGL